MPNLNAFSHLVRIFFKRKLRHLYKLLYIAEKFGTFSFN